MRGHHLWRDVSEINKLREFAARKEKQRLAAGVESETAETNVCELAELHPVGQRVASMT